MRIPRPILLFVAFLLVSPVLNAQQTSATVSRDPGSVSLLQRSLAAMVGTNTVKDVTLTGSANYIAGSDNETGSTTLKATAVGQGRVDLSLSNGPRSEVRDISASPATGSWSDPDGAWHSMAAHNLYSDPTWFFPPFLIGRALSNTGFAISSADAETLNGSEVEHISISQQYAGSVQLAAIVQTLTKVDIYLNSSNLLPLAVAFNAHPDDDEQTNIAVRIQFSDYQVAQGASIPYRIQKYIQNGLALDLSLTSVQFNTGLSTADFQAQ